MKYLIPSGTVFIVKKYNSMFFSHFNKGKQLFRLPIPICFPGQKNSSKKGSTLKTKEFSLREANFLKKSPAFGKATKRFVVVVVLLFYVHCKHLRSWRDGQLS